jgi:hypothetical protein
MSRHLILIGVVSGVVMASAATHAEMSRSVISTFGKQLVVSKDEIPEGKTDKETIAKIKGAQLHELAGVSSGDDVTAWHFHYTAFLARTGASSLVLRFYTDDKEHRFVANQKLDNVDPKSSVLLGEISIDEDQGLAKGKAYDVTFETDKNVVVAETKLLMK